MASREDVRAAKPHVSARELVRDDRRCEARQKRRDGGHADVWKRVERARDRDGYADPGRSERADRIVEGVLCVVVRVGELRKQRANVCVVKAVDLVVSHGDIVGPAPDVTAAHDLASYLSPVGAAELAMLSRTSGIGKPYPPSTPPLAIFGRELVGGLPAVTLANRLQGHQAASSHYSVAQALLNYLATGSLTPHEANLAVLHGQARREHGG